METDKQVVIAVDPGNTETAIVIMVKSSKEILTHKKMSNEDAKKEIESYDTIYGNNAELVIEMVASYGMPVGRSVFDTCVWIGRFMETWNGKVRLIVRKDVKMHICGTTRANDSNIRQALMDKFGSTKELAIGTKKEPGPLYGIGNDERAALALAFTAVETKSEYTLGELKIKEEE